MEEFMIITSYYPPEIGAASNRIYHLADGLKKEFKVRIVTPLPNYPTGKIFPEYRGKNKLVTHEEGIEINRLWIYASKSKNKFVRLFAMLSYSISLIWFFTWNKIPNKVIIQSPPLLVAFTALLFLKSKKRRLILNVSDLWPSAGFELGALKKNFGYSILKKMESFNYKSADVILGQSNEILEHVNKITSKPKLFLYRNFPEIEKQDILITPSNSNKLKIVYAGLLGVAQGILQLCKELDPQNIEFHIYGSGAEENEIVSFIKSNKASSIFFHGRVNRTDLHNELKKYDIAIIPLLNRIYGSVPSKIFEFAKLGLPLLYFGGGEGETIIENNNLGWIAEAGNYKQLNSIINSIKKSDLTFEKRKLIQNNAFRNFNLEAQIDDLKKLL